MNSLRLAMNGIRSSLAVFLCLLWSSNFQQLFAQEPPGRYRVTGYAELGESQVSDGIYLRSAILGSARYGKYRAEAGTQLDIRSSNGNVLSGYSLTASRQMRIREFPFGVQVFYRGTRFSDVLVESNWGFLLEIQRSHISADLGSNFRTYAFTRDAVELYSLDGNSRIRENFNLMYSFSCQLKPAEHRWNIGLSVTNHDYFLINQETNPVYNLKGQYRVRSPVELFAEAWLKRCGGQNLSVNYFGFFFRTGVVWDIR